MNGSASSAAIRLHVGGLTRQELLTALDAARVQRNDAADVLLNSELFDRQSVDAIRIVRRTVGQLGFSDGATLSQIFRKAQELGISPCPAITGPYLRLVMTDQESAPDAVMSNGSAPSGSITVAAVPFDDDRFPKGFYLRVVNGVPWLRGYHATEQHVWSRDDCFAFRDDSSSPGEFT